MRPVCRAACKHRNAHEEEDGYPVVGRNLTPKEAGAQVFISPDFEAGGGSQNQTKRALNDRNVNGRQHNATSAMVVQ